MSGGAPDGRLRPPPPDFAALVDELRATLTDDDQRRLLDRLEGLHVEILRHVVLTNVRGVTDVMRAIDRERRRVTRAEVIAAARSLDPAGFPGPDGTHVVVAVHGDDERDLMRRVRELVDTPDAACPTCGHPARHHTLGRCRKKRCGCGGWP